MYLTEALLWIRTSLTLHKGSLDKDRNTLQNIIWIRIPCILQKC